MAIHRVERSRGREALSFSPIAEVPLKAVSLDPRAAGPEASNPTPTRGTRGSRAILVAGLLAGALDIGAAFALQSTKGVAPERVLQAIASGVLGPTAFSGGAATAALGLFLHFLIACGAAGVFYAASRSWPVLLRRPIMAGILYGVLVHTVMSQIVLPLSRVQLRAPPWSSTVITIAIHMLFVGLPIALTMARLARGAPQREPGFHHTRRGGPAPRAEQDERR
jgi:hypothetical protein